LDELHPAWILIAFQLGMKTINLTLKIEFILDKAVLHGFNLCQ
jgi:hypothetical protein